VRAYDIDAGLYPAVNLGAIAAALGDSEEASKWYTIVRDMCFEAISNNTADYWTHLCLAEALVAQGFGEQAGKALADGLDAGAPPEDLNSATEQLEFFESIGFCAPAARVALENLAAKRRRKPEL
jgi:hypothetical protein